MGSLMARLAEVTVEAPTVNSSELVNTIKTTLGGVFTTDNLVPIIVGALGISAGFFLFWFAYRFISRKAQKALKKGSL